MTEDQRRHKAFAQYLSDELAQLWRAGTKRVERARIEEIGQRAGLDRDETYEACGAARGDIWQGEFVESNEGPGWVEVELKNVPPSGPPDAMGL